MKFHNHPIVSDTDFGRMLKLKRDENTALRHYGEMWKTVAVRGGANEVEFQNQISVLKSNNALLRERVAKWET